MTRCPRRLVIAASLCVACGAGTDVAAQAPPTGTTSAPGLPQRAPSTPPPVSRATAVISGRILAADTGLPLPRARVMVHGTGPNIPSGADANHFAVTGADGAFLFTGLRAGRYYLQAAKARYVTGSFGARPRSDAGRPIELADGQTIDRIIVSLSPAGVITGHVVDDLGEPVEGARVTALREFTGPKGRQFTPDDRSDATDDMGVYRLYGLQPGEYYVSVRVDDAARFGVGLASAAALAPTYYPATAVPAEAQAVVVGAATETQADITLVRVRMTPVSGVVVNAAGVTATGGVVSVRGTIAFGGPETGTDIKPDGSFTLAGIPPGDYLVEARPSFTPREPLPSAAASVTHRRAVSTSIIVTGEPITGLRLVLPDPIRIPVVATFEGATARPPENVTVFASDERLGGSEVAMRGADGRLTLELSPGAWRFGANAPAPWMVKRMTYLGEEVGEVLDTVEVTGEPGGRLEIVFTTKAANLAGSVKDANGAPVPDYVLYVLTADEGRTYPSGRWMVTNFRPDQAGRFKTERLRPGAYIALATEEPDPDAPMGHAEFMERLQKSGTPFRLREGDTVTLDLTLTPLVPLP